MPRMPPRLLLPLFRVVQVPPASVVRKIMLWSPAAIPVVASAKDTARSGGVVVACEFQVAPLLLVRRMTPGYLGNGSQELVTMVGVNPTAIAVWVLITA